MRWRPDFLPNLHNLYLNFVSQEPDTVTETEDHYQGIVTGLAVCFVIVFIYAIIVTFFLSRKCVTTLYSSRQKLLEKVRKPKRLTTDLPAQRNPYQHADEIVVDPSEAPTWGGGNEGQRPNQAALTHRQNPAFEIEDDSPPQIHTPAILPSARPERRYGEPGISQRTVATVEHHQPPAAAATAVGSTMPPSYASLDLEVHPDQSDRRHSPSYGAHGVGARPKHQPSPSQYNGLKSEDSLQYPSASGHHFQDMTEGNRTPRYRGPVQLHCQWSSSQWRH